VLAALIDVAHVGVPIMALIIAAESMGLPVPGESALIVLALAASSGRADIVVVIAAAAAAAIIGDNLGYVIGRRGGRRLLLHPRLHGWGEKVIERGEPFFARHGAKAVFLGRWIAVLRIGAAWLAGINHMPWPRFLGWNAAGGICWAASVGLLVFTLGQGAKGAIESAGVIGAGGVAVAGLGGLLYVRARHRREPAEAGPREAAEVGSATRSPTDP
jgi:membrane protein DedA with SNARE-associated domain